MDQGGGIFYLDGEIKPTSFTIRRSVIVGVATFTVTLQTTGSQELQVNDRDGFLGSATVTVDPAAAARARAAGFVALTVGDAEPTGFGWSFLLPGRKQDHRIGY
jgi:hypothetical protein